MCDQESPDGILRPFNPDAPPSTPPKPPLNFVISAPRPVIRAVNRSPPPAPKANSPPLPIDKRPSIDLTKRGPRRLTCNLNGVPVYLYIDTQGIEYIGIELSKGMRAAFKQEHRQQFELHINEIVNADGKLIKIKRSTIDGLESYKTHDSLLRVSDLEGIMRREFVKFTNEEITEILRQFRLSIQEAEARPDASPKINQEDKSIKKSPPKKRDRDETVDQDNFVLIDMISELQSQVDYLVKKHEDTDLVLKYVSDSLDVRLRNVMLKDYETSDHWKKHKAEIESRVVFEAHQKALKEFNEKEVPRLKADVAQAELERIRKLLHQQ